MIIHLKNGIDKLLFGMKQKDVIAIYGNPNQKYKDEEAALAEKKKKEGGAEKEGGESFTL